MLKMINRCLALVLAASLCFGLMVFPASAEEVGEAEEKVNLMRKPETLTEMDTSEGEAKTFWAQYSIPRNWIRTVEFHDTLDDAPENTLDFSANYDGSVIGWYTPGQLHIAADGKITLNEDSSWMFAYFTNLKEIKFNGCVDTSRVTDMEAMFYFCYRLESVDVTGFDTANVTNMNKMFGYCEKLQSLDVSSFDTGKVEDFSYMFTFCRLIPELDLSNFNTSAGKYMLSMFYRCEHLKNLDTSHFDFSNVVSKIHFDDYVGIK